MCTENKVKRIDKQKTAEETAAVSSCKLRSSKNNGGDEQVADKKDEKEEKKYEFAIKVINAANKQGIKKIKVGVTIDKVEYPYTTDENGRIKLPAKSGGIERTLKVLLKDGSKYTVKGTDHTVKSQEVGGSSTTIELEKQMLEINSLDDHFVPTGKADAENLEIKYSIAKIASISPKPDVFLCISCDEPILGYEVYKYQLKDNEIADGSYMLKWDGKTNCSSGPYKDKLVNPLCGTLEVKLEVRQAGRVILESNLMKTQVLYHSIKLKEASWLEDPGTIPQLMSPIPKREAANANWQNYIKWVQYRLNTLGYFAGPVNGVENAQTKRAIKRYTYEMIDMPETDDPRNAKFAHSLSGEKLKVDLFEDQGVITDPGKKSKIFIQHNYFYHTEGDGGTTNFNLADGHYDKENNHADPKGGKLDRFEYPIEAKVTLISRTDATGDPKQTDGIDAPEAMGAVKIKWTMIDPPEDFSYLPYCEMNSPSMSKLFINDVNTNVLALGGGDNCPEQCGGIKSTDIYFENLIPQLNVIQGSSNKTATTSIYEGGSNPVTDWQGKSAVLFKGSNIGGDNFQVEASISFDGLSNNDLLVKAHSANRSSDALTAKTGEMTVWRYRRVAALIDWCDSTPNNIDWSEITPQFEAAFCKLDTALYSQQRILDIVTTQAEAEMYFNLCVEEFVVMHNYTVVVGANRVPGPNFHERAIKMNALKSRMQIENDHMFPFPLIKGDQLDEAIKETAEQFLQRTSLWADQFKNIVKRLVLGNDTNGSLGIWLAGLNNKKNRPGIILVRGLPFKGIDITSKVGIFRKRTIVTKAKEYRAVGNMSTGIGGGTAYLCEDHFTKLKDGFLIAHEIAHLFYLSHPFQAAADHDIKDENCTMWYLHKNKPEAPPNRSNIQLHKKSSLKSHFCGKCLLKLRGWKVNSPNITVLPPATITPLPTPYNPRMHFIEYIICDGKYPYRVGDNIKWIPLTEGATDPADPNILLGPARFLHKHKLTWESTDGDLKSLAAIKTREKVVYDNPTQGPPFCEAADPDQDFTQTGGDGDKGESIDFHSIVWPALICAYPRVAGKIIAIQRYQYQLPPHIPGTWTDIPEAVFYLEKEVYEKTPGKWVLRFRKYNKADENPNPFNFEVEYKIGRRPATLAFADTNPNATHKEGKNYALEGSSAIYVAGPRKVKFSFGKERVVSLEELTLKGYIAT